MVNAPKKELGNLSLACGTRSTTGVRHRELEVCEDEKKVKWPFSGFCHAYKVDEEGNKVEIEFGEIESVKLGEEGIWDSMFQRPKSEVSSGGNEELRLKIRRKISWNGVSQCQGTFLGEYHAPCCRRQK